MDYGFDHPSDILYRQNTAFACIFNSPFVSGKINNKIYSNDNLIILCDIRLDNRSELIEILSLNPEITDEELISIAYRKWGEDFINYFHGDFAIAIYEINSNKLILFRDRLGVRPLFYAETDKAFIFASDINAILASGVITKNIREEYIAKTISTILANENETLYQNVYRLEAAHIISFTKQEKTKKRYWDLDITKETVYQNEEDYFLSFKEKLIQAIKTRTRTNENIAAELSGGIDSSFVNALAIKNIQNPGKKFFSISHVMPDEITDKIFPFKDERYYSNLLCEYAGIKNHIYATARNKSFLETLEKFTCIHGGLFQHRLPMFSDDLYEKAQENNCKILLSGFGGDEMISYSGAGYKEELIHNWKFGTFFNELGNVNIFNKSKKFISYLLKETLPFIYKYFRPDNEWAIERYKELLIDKTFADKMNINQIYHEKVGFPTDKSLKIRQYKRLMHPHIQGRLEDSCIAARRYNLEYAYPLLDIRLIEHYFSFPSRVKHKNGTGRYTFRRAATDIIPKELQWRKDKTGATVPTVYYRISKDLDKLENLIYEYKEKFNFNYLDYNKTIQYHFKIIQQINSKDLVANPGIYINAIAVMVFIKMLSEGRL